MRRAVSLSRSVSQFNSRSLRKTTFTSIVVYILLLCISFHIFVYQPLSNNSEKSEVFDPSIPILPKNINNVLGLNDDANSDILLLESDESEIDIDTPIRNIGSRKGTITNGDSNFKIGENTGQILNKFQKKAQKNREKLEFLKLESERTMGLKYMDKLKEEGERELPEELAKIVEGDLNEKGGVIPSIIPKTEPVLHNFSKNPPSLLGGTVRSILSFTL